MIMLSVSIGEGEKDKRHERVRKAAAKPDRIVIFSTSPPSVRWHLDAKLGPGWARAQEQKANSVDYVFDTNFEADMTTLEEVGELVEPLTKAGPRSLPSVYQLVKHGDLLNASSKQILAWMVKHKDSIL